jgi:hypothetical protein
LSKFFKILSAIIGTLLRGVSRKPKRVLPTAPRNGTPLPALPPEPVPMTDRETNAVAVEAVAPTPEKLPSLEVDATAAPATGEPRIVHDQIAAAETELSPRIQDAPKDLVEGHPASALLNPAERELLSPAASDATPVDPTPDFIEAESVAVADTAPSAPDDSSPAVSGALDPADVAPTVVFQDSASGVDSPPEALVEPERPLQEKEPRELPDTEDSRNSNGEGSTAESEELDASADESTEQPPLAAEPPLVANENLEASQPDGGTAEIAPIPAEASEPNSPIPFTQTRQVNPVVEPDHWTGFSERATPTRTPEQVPSAPLEPTMIASPPKPPSISSSDTGDTGLPIRRERTPAAAIDASEYVGLGAEAAFPNAYLHWNNLLADRFVRKAAQDQIHLAISPRALASIESEDRGERVAPADAEASLVRAVREAYASHVLGSSARLRIFRRNGREGTPLCIAMLALSVLAAHKMHSDEISSSAAYYIRLADLLNVPRDAGDKPRDFRTLEFESLWTFFANWVSTSTSASLVLPNADDQRRFIAYPLAHVPLRQLDLEKLPEFFDWAGYTPEKRVTSARIADDLRRWEQSYNRLSDAGKAAMEDERSAAVLAQVTSELRAWDGTVATAQGTRSVQAEILLDAVMRRRRLFLLVPRREGFPPVFRTAQVELNATDSWYEPVELGPDESDTLRNGLTWVHEQNPSYVVRRLPSSAVVLAPNAEYSGFVSRPDLPKDILCTVLFHESAVDVVTAYLHKICDTVASAITPRGFPAEWRLFENVRAVRRSDEVPQECEALAVAAYADIIPQGGLRLGSLWSWMLGSPPRILIEGRDGRPVYINQTIVEVDDEGYVASADLMNVAGSYTVRVGSVERTIRIVEPGLRPLGPSARPSFAESGEPRHPVVLSPGTWTLVGPDPSFVLSVRSEGIRDSLVLCDFMPAWAIKVGAGRGSKAIQLSSSRVDAAQKTSKAGSRQWSSTIYEAAIRHPALSTEIGTASADLRRFWGEYVAVARYLKRQWKAR